MTMRVQLREILAGLIFTSEADYPCELFESKDLPEGKEFAFDKFFGDVMFTQEWDGSQEIEQRRKYGQLKKFLEDHTTVQKIVKAGDYYYMVGYVNGVWIGAKAQAVET